MKKNLITFIMISLLVTASIFPAAAHSNTEQASNSKAKTHRDTSHYDAPTKNKKMSNDLVEAAEEQIQIIKEAKKELKEIREALRKKNMSRYDSESLNTLNENIREVKEKHSNLRVLPYQNIISKKASFKFDTPPVIKHGRTLVPVRALTEAYGAEVDWDAEQKKVTIEKDGDTVELYLNQIHAYVNGEQIELDVPAEIMCSRTIVPLRFILEALGYEVDYDEETDTIEIVEDEDDDTVRTDSAITV